MGDKNAFDLLWLVVHIISTVLMVILMLALIGVYIWTYYVHRTKSYEYILARVTDQDTSVTNWISSITVLKYAIFDNSTTYQDEVMQGLVDDGTLDLSGGEQSFSDLQPFCKTNEIYLAEDLTEAEYMIAGFDSIWVMIVDAFFILMMILCLIATIFISVFNLKASHIPFFMRSHKITRWTYLMRFKIALFWIFMIISSFYWRFNMFDL